MILGTRFLLILLFIFQIAKSQGLNLAFNHLTREGGLSNNNVLYMHHDSRGFLWLGSLNGLTRFDGVNCKVYKPTNSGIKGTNIRSIIEDKKGNLWVGSEKGLNYYNRKKDEFTTLRSPENSIEFVSFPYEIDNKDRLWVVISENEKDKLYTYEPISNKYSFISNNISEQFSINKTDDFQEVKTIYCGGANNKGLRKISIVNNKVSKIETFFEGKNNQPLLTNIKEYIFAENDSTIWITGNNLGLIKFNPLKNTYKTFEYYKNNKIFILTQAVNYKHYLLIGSNDGLYLFDKVLNKFINRIEHSPTNSNSLMANWIEKIIINNNDDIFLSQLGFGIDYTNLNRVIAENWLTNDKNIQDNHVSGIFQRNDESWIKFQNGNDTFVLNKKGEIIKKYNKKSPIFIDSDKRAWLTDGQSFFVINPEKNKEKKLYFHELANKMGWLNSMIELQKGTYLISSQVGLFEYNEKNKQLLPLDAFNNKKTVTASPTYYDKTTNQLFISANWWSEFYVLNENKDNWKIRKKFESLPSIVSIRPSIDPNKLWLGTNRGLILFDTKKLNYQIFTESDGLPDNSVTDIIEEPNKNHWLVTNRGISYYNFKKKSYYNFSSKEGVTASEYGWNKGFKLSDGRLVFSSTNGITVINPKTFNEYLVKPKTQITKIYINDKPQKTTTYIGETTKISLKPNQNSFAFDLIGTEYGLPQKLKIHYKLQGVDKNWIIAKNPATARYTNVPEGKYKFIVKTTNEDQRTTSTIKELDINVNAPFWRKLWFRLLVLLTVFGLIYAFYRYRINQLVQMQFVRNRISTDLHDEIGATLSGIGILSTIAQKQLSEEHPAHALLGRITEDAQTVGNSINDIVWSINPNNDDFANIIARMNRQAAELLDAKGINYKIVVPEIIDDIKLNMEQRRDVYLIFKEAMNNLVKYANCTKVDIEIKLENRRFTLLIKDNGKGFDIEKPNLRNGLRNMKIRAKKLEGSLKITTQIGRGTSVLLDFTV